MREKTRTYLDITLQTIEDMRDYWPLTLRQIYYQLVAGLIIDNRLNEYKRLSTLLSDARHSGELSWEAMEDRSRVYLSSSGWVSRKAFVEFEVKYFLKDYRRDLLQDQPIRPEVWIEKDALSRIAHDVARKYCVPVIAARGFSSTSFKNECRNRILANHRQGQQTAIVYLGDLDPSGWEMLPAMMRTFRQKMDLSEEHVTSCRCALNREHVERYQLPRSIDAIKEKDSRTPGYRKLFGDLAVELDALRPSLLEDMVRQAIEANLDMSLFKRQQALEEEDLKVVEALKRQVETLLPGVIGGVS